MSEPAPQEPGEAAPLPTGRVARTARVGALVASQGLRWAGTRTANRLRDPERAAAASADRSAALLRELIEQLARMRGAAMKVGQMISMIELEGLPEEQREELRTRLASLRDDVPPLPFSRLERLLRSELGAPLSTVFADFEERAFAAASIGQVHRARTHDGRQVAVKIQYPGVAEAVDTDLRNAIALIPLLARLAPGLDHRALAAEMRERISEELDYELEAEHQRTIAQLLRHHPFIRVPRVLSELSTRRILVTEYVEGERFEAVRAAPQRQRDRYGEIVFRFFFSLAYRHRIVLGDPHPGNYLLCADDTVCFLDFGLLREIDASRLAAERALARAVRDADAEGLMTALRAGGYLPAERADRVDAGWALEVLRAATGWYALSCGPRRLSAERPRHHGDRAQIHQLTLPAQAVLIRRMHTLVAVVLTRLRASADWGAIAAEYLHGAPPASELGRLEAQSAAAARAAAA